MSQGDLTDSPISAETRAGLENVLVAMRRWKSMAVCRPDFFEPVPVVRSTTSNTKEQQDDSSKQEENTNNRKQVVEEEKTPALAHQLFSVTLTRDQEKQIFKSMRQKKNKIARNRRLD